MKLCDLPSRRIAKLGFHYPVRRDKPWTRKLKPKSYDDLTDQQRLFLEAIPPEGATAPRIAELVGVSRQHARVVLGVLEFHGFVVAAYVGRNVVYTKQKCER